MKKERFSIGKGQGKIGTEIVILTDENADVLYLYYRNGAGGGVTVLVDSEGNPL